MTDKKILSKICALFCAFTVSVLFSACNSVPTEISTELDASQLIQLGQDNYDAGRYKAAEVYYNTVIERFGDDAKHYTEATYELGHLYIKTKHYDKAYNNFNMILALYQAIPTLPGAYKKLSQIELEKIPQKALDEILAKKAAQEADLAAEAEKVKAEEKAREEKNKTNVKPLPLELDESLQEESLQEESVQE